jgi:hypothetical protein
VLGCALSLFGCGFPRCATVRQELEVFLRFAEGKLATDFLSCGYGNDRGVSFQLAMSSQDHGETGFQPVRPCRTLPRHLQANADSVRQGCLTHDRLGRPALYSSRAAEPRSAVVPLPLCYAQASLPRSTTTARVPKRHSKCRTPKGPCGPRPNNSPERHRGHRRLMTVWCPESPRARRAEWSSPVRSRRQALGMGRPTRLWSPARRDGMTG